MRKVLVTILALALTIGAKGQTETIDTAQFVAVYDYECRTQDAEGTPVTDRMQVVVQVGRTVTKSMPLSAYQEMDMEEEDDIMAAHQEAYLHMPTVWTGYPNGQTTVRDWIFPATIARRPLASSGAWRGRCAIPRRFLHLLALGGCAVCQDSSSRQRMRRIPSASLN